MFVAYRCLGCEFIIVAFRSAKVRLFHTLLRSKRRQCLKELEALLESEK